MGPITLCDSMTNHMLDQVHCTNARKKTEAKMLNRCLTASPLKNQSDHHDTLVLCGWRLSSRTWNPISSPWMKQLTWLQIIRSANWCLRLALCIPSGACWQKWMIEWHTKLGLCRISSAAPAGIRHFSKSCRNPALAKIPPEPHSFVGFEKLIFTRH